MAIFSKKIIYGCESRGDYDKPYLTRYTLFKFFGRAVYLHIFHRSDADDLHDHPWSFSTFILWRGYYEETESGKKRIKPFTLNHRNPTHLHRVELIDGKKAVTLVFRGKYERCWGFKVNGVWTYWETYFKRMGC